MTSKLIPIKFRNWDYGVGIDVTIQEVAGSFDCNEISPRIKYSLHTEPSFGARDFDNPIFDKLKSLKRASHNGIPLLWYDDDWSKEFFQFIVNLINRNQAPKIVEIHPPYRDYCSGLGVFLKRYSIFEKLMSEKYPKSEIVIENRTGSLYPKGVFLVSNDSDIVELLRELKRNECRLKLMLDIPQLFTALGGTKRLSQDLLEKVRSIFQKVKENKELIAGIHIWGRKNRTPHVGKLDGLFESPTHKENFLKFISDYFDDDIPRYVVPEVNSSQEDFTSIVNDLRKYFIFV